MANRRNFLKFLGAAPAAALVSKASGPEQVASQIAVQADESEIFTISGPPDATAKWSLLNEATGEWIDGGLLFAGQQERYYKHPGDCTLVMISYDYQAVRIDIKAGEPVPRILWIRERVFHNG